MHVHNTKALEIYRRARAEKRRAVIEEVKRIEEMERVEADHRAFAAKMEAKLERMKDTVRYNNPTLTVRQVIQVAERIVRYSIG